jgi:hypothetical protein
MKIYFDHEKLDVYRKALAFAQFTLLVGLIRSNSPDRMHEDVVEYRVGNED